MDLIGPNMKAPPPAISPSNLPLIMLSVPARKVRREFQEFYCFYFLFYQNILSLKLRKSATLCTYSPPQNPYPNTQTQQEFSNDEVDIHNFYSPGMSQENLNLHYTKIRTSRSPLFITVQSKTIHISRRS